VIVLALLILLLYAGARSLPAAAQPAQSTEATQDSAAKEAENQTAPTIYVIEATTPPATDDAPTAMNYLVAMEAAGWAFSRALQSWNVQQIHSLLSQRVTDRYTPEQLGVALAYFKPKDRSYARFEAIETNNDTGKPVALIRWGSDYTAWDVLALPINKENGSYKLDWMGDLATDDGIVASCMARLTQDAESAKVLEARKYSSSSCIADIAVALHDPDLCTRAFYDRGRCLRALGATLPIDTMIAGCIATSPDNAALARCVWDLALETGNMDVCRSIAANRLERYGCLGQMAAATGDPGVCSEAFNEYTTRYCLERYLEDNGNFADVCAVPAFKQVMAVC
jgi:hypothetical protein